MAAKLGASVGINAANKKDDVMLVQQKLNVLLMSAGGKTNLSSINANIMSVSLKTKDNKEMLRPKVF